MQFRIIYLCSACVIALIFARTGWRLGFDHHTRFCPQFVVAQPTICLLFCFISFLLRHSIFSFLGKRLNSSFAPSPPSLSLSLLLYSFLTPSVLDFVSQCKSVLREKCVWLHVVDHLKSFFTYNFRCYTRITFCIFLILDLKICIRLMVFSFKWLFGLKNSKRICPETGLHLEGTPKKA